MINNISHRAKIWSLFTDMFLPIRYYTFLSTISFSKLGLPVFSKKRVTNFALSFPRVYRGPTKVILRIFGRKCFGSWSSPIDFCINAYFFFIVSKTNFWYFTFWLHDFCISLATRVNSAFAMSLVADFIALVIFTSLSFSWSTILSFYLK